MQVQRRAFFLLILGAWCASLLHAQLPFYTDDSEVTEAGTLHFEFFNEYDGLQSSQFPDLRQNTSNFKLNYGLPHNLELDVDAPLLLIARAPGSSSSFGFGDTDMGIKWKIRKATLPSHLPALAATMYIEFPTGDEKQELGSGLSDYWLNSIAQVPFTDKTRLNANFGFLFAGNTSTGVIGVQTTRGHVYTGGLSFLHDFNPKLTLGAEAYGGLGDTSGLGKDQLQFLVGGQYALSETFSITFGILGGRYEASPQVGGQMGFAVDFPSFFHPSARHRGAQAATLVPVPML